MIIGIDQSKRSTAAVCMSAGGELVDYLLVNPSSDLDGVELIHYQWEELHKFMAEYCFLLSGVALEGLSFSAKSSNKDLLAGLFWYIRTRIYVEFPNIPVGVIPVTSWRSKVLSKEEQKMVKINGGKDAIKKATVSKLPFNVKVKFEEYIREKAVKKEAMYDLCDAYFLSQYRLKLEED